VKFGLKGQADKSVYSIGRWIGHWRATWSTGSSSAPYTQIADGGISHFCKLLYHPKGVVSFFSHWWNVGTKSDLALASFGQDNWLPGRRVLRKFLLAAIPWSVGTFVRLTGSAFAFLQMNLLRDCHLWTQQTSRRQSGKYARARYLRLNNVSRTAVRRTMGHVGTTSARTCIAPSSEPQ